MAFGLDDAYFVSQGLNTIYTMAHDSRSLQKEATPEWMVNAAYNTPANQVARLREAGLNPNLAYGAVNTGNMSGATRSAANNDTSFDKSMALFNSLVSLGKMLKEEDRADRALDLQERGQDLDALKFQSAIAHQQDAMELERKRIAIDLAFKNSELSRRDRDYELRKAQFEWQRSKPQGGAVGYVDRLIGATLGRSPTDVASDTGNFLNWAVGMLLDNLIVKPTAAVNAIKYNSDLGSGMSKIRY